MASIETGPIDMKMITGFLKKIFGSRNDRLIKQYMQTVARINALEAATQTLSDEALRART